jgi:hypothetical protein
MECVRKRNEGAVRRGNVGGHSMEVTEVSWKCERHNQGKIVVDASRQTQRERERERDEGWPGEPTGHPARRKMDGQSQPNGRASSCQMSVVFFIFLFFLFFLFLCPSEATLRATDINPSKDTRLNICLYRSPTFSFEFVRIPGS